MQSTNNESPSSSGRMSPESSQPKITHSGAFWERLPAKMTRSSHQGADGQTLVLLMAPKEQLRGESSTPNISEWPNDAAVCSLSQVLEQTSIPQRFFLSSKACAGILRRAEKRGKKLPEHLRQALVAVAEQELPQPESPLPFLHAALEAVALEQTSTVTEASSQCASTRGGMGRLDAESETLLPVAWDEELNASVEQAGTLLRGGAGGRHDGVMQPINIYGGNKRKDRPEGGFYVRADEDTSKTLDAATGLNPTCSQGGTAVMHAMQVRRLTPVECERLQGFPDNYTNIKDKCPDGPRYKALGNSWAVPVVRWIGERIGRALG